MLSPIGHICVVSDVVPKVVPSMCCHPAGTSVISALFEGFNNGGLRKYILKHVSWDDRIGWKDQSVNKNAYFCYFG